MWGFKVYTHQFYSRKICELARLWLGLSCMCNHARFNTETETALTCLAVCRLCTIQTVYYRVPDGVFINPTHFLSQCVRNHFKSPAHYWYLHIMKSCLCTVALQWSIQMAHAWLNILHNISVFTMFSESEHQLTAQRYTALSPYNFANVFIVTETDNIKNHIKISSKIQLYNTN